MAVASSGGHWTQLLRLKPVFEQYQVFYASTNRSNEDEVEGHRFYYFTDANRKTSWNFFVMVFQILRIMIRERPSIIISTGSAPGLITLMIGKLFLTRNVWIDSIANVEKMSTSGRIAKYFADLYLTQWPELAKPNGPLYKGSVI